MESCSTPKSVKQFNIFFRFFNVATFYLDDSFAHTWHSLNQLHEIVTWNAFQTVLKEFPHILSIPTPFAVVTDNVCSLKYIEQCLCVFFNGRDDTVSKYILGVKIKTWRRLKTCWMQNTVSVWKINTCNSGWQHNDASRGRPPTYQSSCCMNWHVVHPIKGSDNESSTKSISYS